jgi:putative tryptophan/tyrosine transport system substrate-binding protein
VGGRARAGQAVRRAASELGLSVRKAALSGAFTADAYAPVFEEIKASGADGLLVGDGGEHLTHRDTITALAAQHRLPTIYPYRDYVLDGGLLAYGTDLSEANRVGASQIVRLFAGTEPADIPFVQPATFQFIANVKAAQAIGLTLPVTVLQQADERPRRPALLAPVVQLGGAGGGMRRHLARLPKRPAFLEVGGDARAAEGVVATPRW